MTKLDILKLKRMFAVLANEKRIQMIELCLKKPKTVTELSKLLKLNYSITVEYTGMLEKAGLVSKNRNEDKTVAVQSLIELKDNGEIVRIN